MSSAWKRILILVLVTATCTAATGRTPAAAAPLQQEVTADRAALERALQRYDEVRAQADAIDSQVREYSTRLDGLIAEEELCQTRLQARVVAMYRSGNAGVLSLIFGASSIHDLATRLDLLNRMMEEDAENIEALKSARAEAKSSAEELLELQADYARSLDALSAEVSAARKELAASEAALKQYEARVAEAAKSAAAKSDPTQKLTSTGEWKTAVASHYSATFTGRGASGEAIGPYSMIVAHKTLPFGTLIEFEYNGKRAVAHVADRGPYTPGREFDLGPGVVRVLGFNGVHEVRYRIISR